MQDSLRDQLWSMSRHVMWDELGKHIWYKVESKTDNKIWLNTALVVINYHNTGLDSLLREYDFSKNPS